MNPPSGTDDAADLDAPRRLRDDPGADAADSTAWVVGLLRGAAPYRAPAGRKQRVLLRLGHTVRRPAPLLLRFAVMASVLLGGAAIVRAGLGHWPGWMARAYQRVVGATPAAPSSAPARARAARREQPPGAIEAPAAGSELPPPAVTPERDAMREPPRARRAVAAIARAASEDTSPVSAAMRALRVEHDPVRARGLLARYLNEHPNGNLAEEALAMSIEAALVHNDGDVAALASRYLRLHPQGSFQGLARQALAAQPQPGGAPPAP